MVVLPFPEEEALDAVNRLISESGAQSVAVGYCSGGQGGNRWVINPDQPFHAASTMKVCVLLELYHQASQGKLHLTDGQTIHNEFRSIVDGSSFSLGVEEDSETGLYLRIGDQETLLNLAVPMIQESSNLATNLLVERLGATNISDYMQELGAPGLVVRRGVEDGKAYRLGLNNTVTAMGLLTIFTKLLSLEILSREESKSMIDIMLGQKHRNGIPAKLPSDARVANKTGWNELICHDCGIIYPQLGWPFSLVVLTSGLDEHTAGPELIASIAELLYDTTAPCARN